MPRHDIETSEGTGTAVAGPAAGESPRESTDKLVRQVKDQVSTLRGQAGDRLRAYADDGKGKGANLLEELGGVIDDAARSIDERLGSEYGDYAHRAAGAVSSFAGKVRDKSVDDIVAETRDIVRRSPVIAIAAAAVVGFALMRVLRTGIEDAGEVGRPAADNDGA
jgi:ElaB/YqjD/DUF883 family membrane-anchored ribosome-binding protein